MFRNVTKSDKDIFLNMMKNLYSSSAVSQPINKDNFELTFSTAIEGSPLMRALIIEVDQKIAGYGLISFTYSNEAGGLVVLIEELYIDEAFRGQGLAGKFFEFIEKEYALAKRFRLEVTKSNQAIQLYERLGYKALDYIQMIKEV